MQQLGQTSNYARWRERINGAADVQVPDRRRGRIVDRFNARMQLEIAEEQNIHARWTS